jgi:hypothetical protein
MRRNLDIFSPLSHNTFNKPLSLAGRGPSDRYHIDTATSFNCLFGHRQVSLKNQHIHKLLGDVVNLSNSGTLVEYQVAPHPLSFDGVNTVTPYDIRRILTGFINLLQHTVVDKANYLNVGQD